ncbi:hypothetical protein GQ54DRAFT_278952 [Martensiomyces pterosporus]|nr:hypothetical protein GQ54DRAFT_278952 [Martensiomyces pterosporus]
MPLLNGQVVEPAPAPVSDVDNTRAQAWQIRFTGEVFDDYDRYLDRLAFYRKPIWSCKESGQSELTYEQALLSERAENHRLTGVGFSDALICQMLTFISQSNLSISLAIDALYYRFQYDFFLNEHIDVKYPDTEGAMYECFVVGIGALPQKPPMGVFNNGSAGDANPNPASSLASATAIAIGRLGDAAEDIIAIEQRKSRIYTVRLFDIDGNPIDDSDISVPATELSRSRNVFTKVALRQFLDDHTERSSRPGSPWIVRPEWRERFHIPYMYGGEARLLRNARAAKRATGISIAQLLNHPSPAANQQQQAVIPEVVIDPRADERQLAIKPFRKFPIDDQDFVQYNHIKWNDGTLWALRRKSQKLEAGHDNASAGAAAEVKLKPQAPREITDYFSAAGSRDAKPTTEDSIKDSETEQDVAAEKDGGEEEEDEPAMKNRWPIPLCEWQVPASLVSRTLAVYMFLSCFSTPLQLTPYPLDYFESALVYRLPDPAPAATATDGSSVYRESIIALLNSIIAERKRGQNPANVEERVETMVAYQDGNMTEPEDLSADESGGIQVDDTASLSRKEDAAEPMDVDNPEIASAKLRANRTIAKQVHSLSTNGDMQFVSAIARRTRSGRSRLQYSSTLSNSTGVSSAESSSDTEFVDSSSTTTARNAKDGGRRSLNRAGSHQTKQGKKGRQGKSGSPATSRAATPATKDNAKADDETKLAAMRPHQLLRHLSRNWANSLISKKRHTWIYKLVGWINEACYDYPELVSIYDALWNAKSLALGSLEETLWNAVDLEKRLVILELLVGECTNNESTRKYLDLCAETTAELKRERVEIRRELKKISESLAALDREENTDAQEAGSKTQARKEKEEEQRRQKERRKLGESERQHLKRIDHVERELRRSNIGRLAPLGTDRYFNRYYFIDGIGGCPVTGGSGRIFVQPATAEERNDAVSKLPRFAVNTWALDVPGTWSGGLAVTGDDSKLVKVAFPNEQDRVTNKGLAKLGEKGELWGYYATTGQLDSLKRWLEPRGKREAALLAELELIQTAISGSIRRRCQSLEQSFEARARSREHICDRISAHLDSTPAADALATEKGDEATSSSSSTEGGAHSAALAKLQDELNKIDQTPVPPSLLPPALLVEQRLAATDQACGEMSLVHRSISNETNPSSCAPTPAAGDDDAKNSGMGSSRASSAEPPSSADMLAQQSKRLSFRSSSGRGRRPKNRNHRHKEYVEEFLEYENPLLD